MLDKISDFVAEIVFGPVGLLLMVVLIVVLAYWLNNRQRSCIERGGTPTYIDGNYSGCVEAKQK